MGGQRRTQSLKKLDRNRCIFGIKVTVTTRVEAECCKCASELHHRDRNRLPKPSASNAIQIRTNRLHRARLTLAITFGHQIKVPGRAAARPGRLCHNLRTTTCRLPAVRCCFGAGHLRTGPVRLRHHAEKTAPQSLTRAASTTQRPAPRTGDSRSKALNLRGTAREQQRKRRTAAELINHSTEQTYSHFACVRA